MTRSSNIYILGAGSMGGLVGYELSTLANKPNITLLLRNAAKVNHFNTVNKSTIYINRLFKDPIERVSAKFSAATSADIGEEIENLIITTKTYQTEEALKDYLPFIKPTSNILLIQNGLGVVDQLYQNVWPDVSKRPNIFQGVISHGAFVTANTGDNYEISHAGFGDLKIAKFPRDLTNPVEEKYEKPLMLKQLEDAMGLETSSLSYSDLSLIQIKKFVVNACINPVTAVVDCVNGELRSYNDLKALFYDIISEIVDVFLKTNPLLKQNPKTKEVLNKNDLTDYVVLCGTVWNVNNSSSMRQDTLHLRQTEIDYINGYVVKVAEDNGLKADVNKTITQLVKLRLSLNQSRVAK